MASAVYYGLELIHMEETLVSEENPSYIRSRRGNGSSKSFLIDHPTQTGKKLMVVLRGQRMEFTLEEKSQTLLIEAPEYWSGLVDIDTMTVDVTPIGPNQSIYVE